MTEGVYSVRGAARRVHRSRQSIQKWLRHGLPHRRLGTYHVEIDEADLLAWYRARLLANPNRKKPPAGISGQFGISA